MFWTFFLWVCTSIVSAYIASKPQGAKAASTGDFDFPTAEEGRPISMAFGDVEFRAPNVTWWALVKVKAIRKNTGGFFRIGSKTFDAGHKYYVGMQMVLATELDAITDILVADKSLGVSASYNALGTRVHIDKPNLFGGEGKEGGISGDVDIYFGSDAQLGNDYLQSVVGAPVPGYRGVSYIVLRKVYIGTQPYLKEWKIRGRRCPTLSGCTATYANISGEANPAFMVGCILTTAREKGGRGLPVARLDVAAFNAAAATLYNEGFGLSLLMDTSKSADDWIQDICRHVDAAVYTDPSTGLVTMRLIRADYDPSTLLELSSDDIKGTPEMSRPSWSETLNRIVVRYTSRANGFVVATAQDRDPANKAIRGEEALGVLDFMMAGREEIAQRIATRERRTHAYPLASFNLVCNRRGWRLAPGAPFKVTFPRLGLHGLVCRVSNIRYGTLESREITIEGVEDVFSTPASTYDQPPVSSWTDSITDPVPSAQQTLVEAPYWMVGAVRSVLAMASRSDQALSADIWTKETFDYLQTSVLTSMTPTAVLTAPYSCKTAAMDYSETLRLSAGPDMDTLADHNTAIDGVNHGQNLAVFESGEIVSWMCMAGDDSTGYWPLGVLRGCLDTVPTDHAAGERIWFLSQGVADVQGASNGSGLPGADGTNGANGTNGQDGAPGADGQDGVGVPAGGATGQALVKLSATDFDTGWADVSSSGGSGGHVFHPDAPFATPSALDDNFEQASLLSKWTKVNFDSTTPAHTWDIATTRIKQLFSQLAGGSAGDTQRVILQSLPSGDFTVWTKLVTDLAANYQSAGLILSSTNTAGTGSQVTGCSEYFSSAQFMAEVYTNFNTYGSTLCSFSKTSQMGYLRLRRSGTNYYFGYSYDGEVWSESSITVGFTPAYIGLTIKNNHSTIAIKTAFKFFRYRPSATAVLGGLV